MRAATVIVGAIAVASILVALSLIVSGGGDSGQTVVTKTVVEKVEAPAKEALAAEEEAGGGAQFGGPTQCGSEFTVENTSCEVGEQIHAGYVKSGGRDLSAMDAETGETIGFACKDETAPVTCTGSEGAVVYFEP